MEKKNSKVFLDIKNYKAREDLSVCALAILDTTTEDERSLINLVLSDFHKRYLSAEDIDELRVVLNEMFNYIFSSNNFGVLFAFSRENFKDKYIAKLLENISRKLNFVLGKNTEELRNYLVLTPRIKEKKYFKSKFKKTTLIDGKFVKSGPFEAKSLAKLLEENFKYVRMGLFSKIGKHNNEVSYLSWASGVLNTAFCYVQSNEEEITEEKMAYIGAILPFLGGTFGKNNIYILNERL